MWLQFRSIQKIIVFLFALLTTISFVFAAEEIVIGQVGPYTGPLANTGTGMMLGGKIYFDYINSRGGIYGAKIHFVTKDDGYKAEETVKQVKEMIAKENPVALFGLVGTANVEALAKQNVLMETKVPVVGIRTGAISLHTPPHPYLFHTRARYQDEGAKIVEQVATLGIKNIAVLYQDDSFGLDGLAGVESAMNKLGLKPVAKGSYPRNTTKVEAAVKTIKDANPQAVIMVSNTAASAEFTKQFRADSEINKSTQLIAFSVTDGPGVCKLIGPEAAHGLGITQVTPNPYNPTTAAASEFRRNLKKFAPKDTAPSFTLLEGYLAAKVLVEGLKRAGKNPTRERLVRALESLHNYDVGDFLIGFSRSNHSGSRFVELSILDRKCIPRQ